MGEKGSKKRESHKQWEGAEVNQGKSEMVKKEKEKTFEPFHYSGGGGGSLSKKELFIIKGVYHFDSGKKTRGNRAN